MKLTYALAGMLATGAASGAITATYLRFYPTNVAPQPQVTQAEPPAPVMTQPVRQVRGVMWFKAHPEQIAPKKNGCNDNPGLAPRDPECANVNEAERQLFFASSKDIRR